LLLSGQIEVAMQFVLFDVEGVDDDSHKQVYDEEGADNNETNVEELPVLSAV
jgi:hypothetical protein